MYTNTKIRPYILSCLFTIIFCSCEQKTIELELDIYEKPATKLTFKKQTKDFSSSEFTTADILKGVQGNKKDYTLKNITNITPTDVVRLSGTKPNFSLDFLKEGNFTATIVLEHLSKKEITINNAAFEITSGVNPYNLPIKNFHVPGLFVIGYKNYKATVDFMADNGKIVKNVYKKINGKILDGTSINFVKTHKNGLVFYMYDGFTTKGYFEITDKNFKTIKKINSNGAASSINIYCSIINQKLYYTTTGNTYILDLNSYTLQKFKGQNIVRFMRDGAGNLYFWDSDHKLYKAKDKNDLNKGGHLIKHFYIDKTIKTWDPKESVADVKVDNSGKFWLIKSVIKKPRTYLFTPSTYEFHIITKDLNTGIEKTTLTKIIGTDARLVENKYNGKRYFVYTDEPNKVMNIQELLVDSANNVTLGKVVKTLNTTKSTLAEVFFLFTKNGFVFIRKDDELLKGKSDFSAIKKIATVSYISRIMYNAF